MSFSQKTYTVLCPACKGDSIYAASNKFRPFCSARCKGIDLGAWASEEFRVGAAPNNESENAVPSPKDPTELH